MKTSWSLSLATLALVAILAPTHAAAQSSTINVTVPFGFSVGSQTFPAGEYVLASDPHVTSLASADRQIHKFVLGHAVETENGKPKMALVFKRYGDRYFLSQIWPGTERGTQLLRSPVEREMSASYPAPVSITLVASR